MRARGADGGRKPCMRQPLCRRHSLSEARRHARGGGPPANKAIGAAAVLEEKYGAGPNEASRARVGIDTCGGCEARRRRNASPTRASGRGASQETWGDEDVAAAKSCCTAARAEDRAGGTREERVARSRAWGEGDASPARHGCRTWNVVGDVGEEGIFHNCHSHLHEDEEQT